MHFSYEVDTAAVLRLYMYTLVSEIDDVHEDTIEIVHSSARLRMYMGIQLIGF